MQLLISSGSHAKLRKSPLEVNTVAQERQESNVVAAVKAVAEILAQQDRRVEASEVEEAVKEAYKSAKRN